MWGYGLDRAGSGQGQVTGTCECGNEPSRSVKCGEFLDYMRTGQFLKKDSIAWSELRKILIFENETFCLEVARGSCGYRYKRQMTVMLEVLVVIDMNAR